MLQITIKKIALLVLCLALLQCCQKAYPDKPEKVLDNYYKALASKRFGEARGYVSEADKTWFKTEYNENDIYPKIVAKTWALSKWRFNNVVIRGNNATVEVSLEMPNVGEIFGNLTGEALSGSATSGASYSELQQRTLLQLENKSFSYTKFIQQEHMIYENNNWKIQANIEKKRR